MTVDLAHPDTYTHGVPHDVFRELRATDPVSWRPEAGGFWAVTRYHDVVHVLRTPALFSSWRGGVLLDDPPPQFLDRLRESMMNKDPPDHTVMRRMVNKAINPRRIEQLEGRIATHARALVDRVRDRGRCDFATDVAAEMPLFMICEILGVPDEDRRALYGLTQRMFNTEITDAAAAMRDKMAAAGEMRAYGGELARRKSAAPADDLASELLTAEVDGRRLTPSEFEAFFMLLFNAGTDTTRSLLCYGLDLLLDRADERARLRADPALWPRAVDELIRYVSPVIQIRRTATAATALGDRPIAEGDKVVVFFPSANRDEAVFTDPDRLDLARAPNDHVGFGFGAHFCLGAPLARLEARHVLEQVLALDGLERAAPPVPARTNFVRGLHHLEIAYSAG